MARHRVSFSPFVLCLAVVLSLPQLGLPRAAAQSASEKAAAEALFDRGLSLMKEGKYQEACERLEQSQSIERGIGTMLYLADCYEKLGNTASAWALFREASSLAQAAGQGERADAGRRRAERLEKGLSRLTVQVAVNHRLPGLEVRDNGALIHASAWGLPVPVDPGPHRIEARAPGYGAWAQELKVEANAANVEVQVPALVRDESAGEPLPVASPAPDMSPNAAAGGQPAAPAVGRETRMSTLRIVGLALGSAGVAALAVGTGFGIKALNKADEVDKLCGERDPCPADPAQDIQDDAKSAANVSNAMLVVGGALVIGGLVTFLLGPKHRRADVGFHIDRQRAALHVGGVF